MDPNQFLSPARLWNCKNEINFDYWLLLLNDYYATFCTYEDWEKKTGLIYESTFRTPQDRMNAWEGVILPFFEHYGYDEFCYSVQNAISENIDDIKNNGFDRHKHFDLIVKHDGEEYLLHLPNPYDEIEIEID